MNWPEARRPDIAKDTTGGWTITTARNLGLGGMLHEAIDDARRREKKQGYA